MPISLKHINTSDSDSIKLDKVNYNFDQLVWNGGGPRGPQGPIGETGTQGTSGKEGVQGPIGDTGYQGTQGGISDNYWKNINSGAVDVETLIPIHTAGDQFAPVVKIGYVETDTEYGEKLPLVGGKTPYQWNINRRPYSSSNLQFLNNDITEKAYDFQLKAINKKNQMTIGFLDPTDSTSIYISAGFSFRNSNSIGSDDSLYISSSESFFKTATVFNSPAVIKDNLIIENAFADTNKVAICSDDSGLVEFKSIEEIEGTVPFGTIISIMPSIFSINGNFINSETVVPDNDFPLQLSVGKGVGAYNGWYLCNGKVWTNGVDNYQVPSLGQFNYTIADNRFSATSNSQGVASSSPSQPVHITGGSDIDMTAAAQSISVYNVTSTVSTSSVNASASAGTTFRIKQLPQIIYLNDANLYWFDAGTGQNPAIPLTFLLDDANTTASKLSPDPYTLKNITNQGANNSYNFTATVDAPAGYYWLTPPDPEDITGLPGYATITSISLGSGPKPTTINVFVSISSHPSTTQVLTLNINTTPFTILADVNITLNRTNSAHITCTTPEIESNVSYNLFTGKTFTLIYEAFDQYYFPQNSPTVTIISPPGGADGTTLTINNWALTNGNKTLTMNVSLTGLPLTGYLTTIEYSINSNEFSTSPIITAASGGFVQIDDEFDIDPITEELTIENYTGNSVYIWVGIYQYFGGITATRRAITARYRNEYAAYDSPYFALSANALPFPSGMYYSLPYQLANNSTLTGDFGRDFTTDSAYNIQLYWTSTLDGTKLPLSNTL